jgi:hypothetical protein
MLTPAMGTLEQVIGQLRKMQPECGGYVGD